MFMRLPANDPAPTASPRVKTKLAVVIMALLLAIAMVACGSESSTPSEATPLNAVTQADAQGSAASPDSSATGNAADANTERQQPTAANEQQQSDSAQPEATTEPTNGSVGDTPTDEPEAAATTVLTPTLEPNENAFRWLLHEPDDPRCTIGPKNREAIARQMTAPVSELTLNAYREATFAAIEEMGSLAALQEHYVAEFLANLDLERLPDENGELRVSATYTGSLAPVTDDVYTVTFVPAIQIATAGQLLPEACQAEDEELVAMFSAEGREAIITDVTGAKVNPRPEPEPFPELAMMLGDYDAKDQFGNYRYEDYYGTKIFEYNYREIGLAVRPSLNNYIMETYPAVAGWYRPEQIGTLVYRNFQKRGGAVIDVDWTLNEDNTVNITALPYLSDIYLEEEHEHYIFTVKAVLNLVPADELPPSVRQFVKPTSPLETFRPVYPVFSHLLEHPIKLEPCEFVDIQVGGAHWISVCRTE